MGKIKQGMSTCVAVLGVFSLMFGIALSACAWMFASKFSNVTVYQAKYLDIVKTTPRKNFASYWWGGLVVSISSLIILKELAFKKRCFIL